MRILKNILNFPSICCLILSFAYYLEESHDTAIAQKYCDFCLLVLQNLLATTFFFFFLISHCNEKGPSFSPQMLQTGTKL